MKCDFCDHDASIEIVVFVNGKAQKVHMCLDCYREKLSEMMENMPKTIDGGKMAEQIREMLENAGQNGGLSGLEFSFMPNLISLSEETEEPEEGTEESEDSTPFPFASLSQLLNLTSEKGNAKTHSSEDGKKSARELAFDKQRRELKKRRAVLMEKMQMALQEEEYEKCATYRDELNEIADALVRLNEERKDPYGV